MAVELEVISGSRQGESLRSQREAIHIGDSPQSDLAFDPGSEPAAKGRQAVLALAEAGWVFRNLGSGTWWVDQSPVSAGGSARLKSGSVIRLSLDGPDLVFTIFSGASPTAPPAAPVRESGTSPFADVAANRPAAPAEPIGGAASWLPIGKVVLTCAGAGALLGLAALFVGRAVFHWAPRGAPAVAAAADGRQSTTANRAERSSTTAPPMESDSPPPSDAPPPPRSEASTTARVLPPAARPADEGVARLASVTGGGQPQPFGHACAVAIEGRTLLLTSATLVFTAAERSAAPDTTIVAVFPNTPSRGQPIPVDLRQLMVLARYYDALQREDMTAAARFDVGLLFAESPLPAAQAVVSRSAVQARSPGPLRVWAIRRAAPSADRAGSSAPHPLEFRPWPLDRFSVGSEGAPDGAIASDPRWELAPLEADWPVGGPVLSAEGEVLAICTTPLDGSANAAAWAVPVDSETIASLFVDDAQRNAWVAIGEPPE